MQDFNKSATSENEKDRLIIDLQDRNAELEQKIKLLEEKLQFDAKIKSYNLELRELELYKAAFQIRERPCARVRELVKKLKNKESLNKEELQSIQHLVGILETSLETSLDNLYLDMPEFPLYLTLPILARKECAKARLKLNLTIDKKLDNKHFAQQITHLLYRIVYQFINNVAIPTQATQCNIALTWNKARNRLLLEMSTDKCNPSWPSDATLNDFKEHYSSLEDFLQWRETLKAMPGCFDLLTFKHWVVGTQGTFTVLSSPENGLQITIDVPALPGTVLDISVDLPL